MVKLNEIVNESGITVVELKEDMVALVNGDKVQINQLKWNAKNNFDYDSIYLTKELILALAEHIKGDGING